MKRNILLLFTFFACITVQGQTPVRLVDLRSEHLDRPIGLDNPVPVSYTHLTLPTNSRV